MPTAGLPAAAARDPSTALTAFAPLRMTGPCQYWFNIEWRNLTLGPELFSKIEIKGEVIFTPSFEHKRKSPKEEMLDRKAVTDARRFSCGGVRWTILWAVRKTDYHYEE